MSGIIKAVCNTSAEGSVTWGKNQFKIKISPALAYISMGGKTKFPNSRTLDMCNLESKSQPQNLNSGIILKNSAIALEIMKNLHV